MTVIELGSGPGLAGLLAAKCGAQVVITDKAVVLPLIEENIRLNGLSVTPTASCSGTAAVRVCQIVCQKGVGEVVGWRDRGGRGRACVGMLAVRGAVCQPTCKLDAISSTLLSALALRHCCTAAFAYYFVLCVSFNAPASG